MSLDVGDKAPDFSELDTEIVGISKDSPKKHDSFKAKYDLKFTLASDPAAEAIQRYGAWVEKSMYGRTYIGIDRSTFLIDRNGVVRSVRCKVKVPGRVDEVLAAARGL